MVSVIVFVVVTITVLEVRRERASARNQLEQRGLQLGITLNQVMFNSVYFLDISQLRDRTQAFASQADIASVQIFTPDGRLLVDSASNEHAVGTVDTVWPLNSLRTRRVVLKDNQGTLEMVSPIAIGGELIGGCDIIMEMYQNGELQPIIKAAITE